MLPELPTSIAALLFLMAAVLVWYSGSRLAYLAHAACRRKGWDGAFVGLIALGVITDLPELAATLSASATGNAPLALSNMLGGVTMQTAILAVADATFAGSALTAFIPRSVVLLQGAALILLLALTLSLIAVGESFVFMGVGLWPVVLFGGYLVAIHFLRHYGPAGRWKPVGEPMLDVESAAAGTADVDSRTFASLLAGFCAAAALVFVCGVVLAGSAEQLAERWGLGSGFIGATLLASSTSLPEVSTTIAAVRLGAYSMAIGNIFGSNLVMVALLLPADIAYREGAILDTSGPESVLLLATGILVTAIYLVGLIERRNRIFLRMGWDSLAVVAVYVLSLFGLYAVG